MKILAVDDSAVMRKLIARSLGTAEGPGVEVVEAADGMEALAAIAHHGPSIDLVLCNMNMPNVDGLSLLRSLRGSPEFKHIPFVIVTADASDGRTAQALREGASGVIGKPFRPDVIAAMVREKRSHGGRVTSGRSRDRYYHGNGSDGTALCQRSVTLLQEGCPACCLGAGGAARRSVPSVERNERGRTGPAWPPVRPGRAPFASPAGVDLQGAGPSGSAVDGRGETGKRLS